ncbi:MAG: sigma-70 family RNA polymerase sigma factor [Planctomycetota bacterium]|nr:sigma-70 family RNA polymerase sigma factor [Planctomycetota bacterium]
MSGQEPDHELKPASPPASGEDDSGFPEELRNETKDLVELAKHGDTDALNELFKRYHGFMVEVARKRLGARLKLKEEADDLAQTTFREATRDFGRYEYRGEGSLLRWLLQILHNKIRDKAEYYAAGKRDVTRERRIDDSRTSDSPGLAARREPPSEELTVTRQVQRSEEFAILREALEDLSPDHRTAITLVFFQGLSLRKAGERMGGRSEDAVRMLLRRAEKRLRELTRARLGS